MKALGRSTAPLLLGGLDTIMGGWSSLQPQSDLQQCPSPSSPPPPPPLQQEQSEHEFEGLNQFNVDDIADSDVWISLIDDKDNRS